MRLLKMCCASILLLFLLSSGSSAADLGSASGRVLVNGQEPLAKGRISFFWLEHGPPYQYGKLRRVPEMTAPLGEDGAFGARLKPGRYFVGAMSRDMFSGPGSPTSEEQTFSALDPENNLLCIDIESGKDVDLGVVTVTSRKSYPAVSGVTLSGMVTDEKGLPFAGAFLFIKRHPGGLRPSFIWGETGEDGLFTFTLPAGKSYYLLAKDLVNVGRPSPGRHIGIHNGSGHEEVLPAPAAITGREGETVADLRIVMHEIPPTGPLRGGPTDEILSRMGRAPAALSIGRHLRQTSP